MSSSFVTAKGRSFELEGLPFRVQGVNCYFLAYCSDESRRKAMAIAKRNGATVIRAWAFLAVDKRLPGTVAFQHFDQGRIITNDGPDGLERLDALIKAAEDADIKLILPFINHWKDFGGMPAYVRWLGSGQDVSEFYRFPALRAAYREWVDCILSRRNTITGRLYSEEPSIMAWELTNEARCAVPGGRDLLHDWIEEMSGFVKQKDSNHLLALGDEGMFHRRAWRHLYSGCYGVDWEKNLSLKNMDFGTFHFYPQDWGFGNRKHFAERWIRDHAAAGKKLNKPVVMEEFGLRLDGRKILTPQDRDEEYTKWMAIARERGLAGELVWMLGHKSPDTEGYIDDYVLFEAEELPAIPSLAGMAGG